MARRLPLLAALPPPESEMLGRLLRVPGMRRLFDAAPWLPPSVREAQDLWWSRPGYGYGTAFAARLAHLLGLPRITVMEWGVVQGDGLVELERIAATVSGMTGVGIDVAAFDTGEGLPEPVDYRDCAHVWGRGFYRVDEARVRARIARAELRLGPVGASIATYLARPDVAPVGFIACNLDYYSLAAEALEAVANSPAVARLPRIMTLFDDLVYPERACHNDWVGERLAIREFNERHAHLKVAPMPAMRWLRRSPAPWQEMQYVIHDFRHPLYTRMVTPEGYRHRQV